MPNFIVNNQMFMANITHMGEEIKYHFFYHMHHIQNKNIWGHTNE